MKVNRKVLKVMCSMLQKEGKGFYMIYIEKNYNYASNDFFFSQNFSKIIVDSNPIWRPSLDLIHLLEIDMLGKYSLNKIRY
jgi:hypothetical protein